MAITRTPEHLAALRAGLKKYQEAGGKMGRPVGPQASTLAGALEQYDKAETAVRLALAREIKVGGADPELVRRAVSIVTR